MITKLDLPEMPDGMTAAWLTPLLRQCGLISADTEVTQVEQQLLGEGTGMMSDLVRLSLDYAGGAGPASLVAKFSARNDTNRAVAMQFNLYERETRYFAELDQLTSSYSPATYVSALDEDQFLILMDDLSDYRVGNQASGAGLTDTELMVDELAKLHASFWNQVDDLTWVPTIADSYHAENMAALIKVGWPVMVETFGDCLSPQVAAMGEAFSAGLPKLQAAMVQRPITLLHGDYRMENVMFGTHPEHHPAAIIDWQGPLRGCGLVDLSVVLCGSTQIDVRRGHEKALVQRYVEGLAKHGVQGYGEQAWQDYRMATLYNWVYVGVIAGTLDATNEKGVAWISQMLKRQDAATLDHELIELLQRL